MTEQLKTGVVLLCQIVDYDKDSGIYKVCPVGELSYSDGFPAKLLSPIPFQDGGLSSIPSVPKKTQCWCIKYGLDYYILGFSQMKGPVGRNSGLETRPLEPGDTQITNSSGSFVNILKKGIIQLFAHPWAQILLDPLKANILGYAKNFWLNLWGGFIGYQFDDEQKTGTFAFRIYKKQSLAALKVGESPPDYISGYLGARSDTHLAEIFTEQNINSTGTAVTVTNFEYGRKNSGEVLAWSAKDNTTNASINVSVSLTGIPLQVKVIPSGKPPTTMIVDTDGNVTFKLENPDAHLYLGGTGKEQQLVTKGWHDAVYVNHFHNGSAPGSPTTPPIQPQSMIGSADSPTNHFTFTTKAE